MADRHADTTYFSKAGPHNSAITLALAKQRADELDIEHILVATTSGQTGASAIALMGDRKVVAVSHCTGFAAPNEQSLTDENRSAIEAAGGRILTCQHALGGVGRAVRRKLGSYQIDEIMAFTLRNFCEGIKVGCEITVMAADAGLVPAGEEVIAIGGTGRGCDTAAVILAANTHDFFELRVLEIICKPRIGGRLHR